MDTLFRLVSFQKHQQQPPHSFNSTTSNFTNTTNSSSSKSSSHLFTNNNYQQQNQDQEECFNFFMDEDDFSSSSSRHHHHNQYYNSSHPPQPSAYDHHQSSNNTPTTSTTATPPPYAAFSSSDQHQQHQSSDDHPHINYSYSPVQDVTMEYSNSFTANSWASDILVDAARAVADKNSARLQQLMWMLNELSSPYGDTDQKLSSYFLQALFARMTESGERSYRTLSSASDKMCSFESTRKLVLKFQEVSPWTTFGHVASNGAIMEAFDGESKLHIIDVSNTFCTQWPTLLEAIATRTDETPHLRITTIIVTSKLGGGGRDNNGSSVQKVMREIGNRMEKFARLMGVPFKFDVIHHMGDLSDLNFTELGIHIQDDEALAINLNGTLRSVNSQRREYLMSTLIRSLNPKIVTVVDEEADLDVGSDGFEFVRGFQECLRWFRVYFETLDESFPKTSNERLMLERGAGRAIMDLVACTPAESMERRESATRWSARFHASGFTPVLYSDEVCDDVRALLRRYREGWSMNPTSSAGGMFLSWKETPVVWASAWKMI